MNLIALDGVEIGYEKPILPPITLHVARGERVGILGPNGAGKSTLLRTVLGLLPPVRGAVGYPLGRRPRVGYVPQAHRPDPLFPVTAWEVVMMGRFPGIGIGRPRRRVDREAALEQLAAVGLADQQRSLFRELSGGQRQRVLVARALAGDPELLVLDEPTSEMDPAAEHGLLELVEQLAAKREVAVLFVTHQISAAAAFASSLALINRSAAIVECGPAAELLTSARLSKLYGRPVEVRREDGRTLVWMQGIGGAA